MNYKKLSLVAIVVVIITSGAILGYSRKQSTQEATKEIAQEATDTAFVSTERKAIVYKAPNCGCCNGYIAELEKQGFAVETKSTKDMDSVKKQYGIPDDKESCHTTVVGDYFIEGHVPLVAVEKLLSEKPDIDGIGLPGMPIGTPGMPGEKQASYEIYQKSGSDFSQFMIL
jgi:hypothetical protein